MGIVCDQEIVQLVGTEENFMKKIAESLEECHTLGIFAQNQALKYVKFPKINIQCINKNLIQKIVDRYLATKKKQRKGFTAAKGSIIDEMKDILGANVLNHVPVSSLIYFYFIIIYLLNSLITGNRF